MGKVRVATSEPPAAIHGRTTRDTPLGRVVLLAGLSAAAVLLWAASGASTTTTERVTLSTMSVTAVAWGCALIVANYRKPHQVLLRLGPWMLTYAGMAFGLASVTAWLAPESVSSQIYVEAFRDAHALVILGLLAFTLGYVFTPRVGLHRLLGGGISHVQRWNEGRRASPTAAVLTYSLGLGALVLGALLSGKYGYLGDVTVASASDVSWYTQVLEILGSLRGFAILALWVTAFQRTAMPPLLLALAVTAVDLTAGLLTGMKEAPIVTLIAVGLGYIFVKRRLPVIGLVVVGAWFTFFLSPLVTSLRSALRGDGTLTLREALPEMASGISQANTGSGDGLWLALARFRLIDNVAIISQKTPSEIPFLPISDLATLALSGFIPRAVWPTKPVRTEGRVFYQEYYEGVTYSSSALTVPGSLFMYGGTMVLIVGMLLFGMLTRSLDDGMRAHDSYVGLLLLFALMPSFVKMEASASTLLASLPVVGVGWILACAFLFRSPNQALHR